MNGLLTFVAIWAVCTIIGMRRLEMAVQHGVRSRYLGGCRCVECKLAQSVYLRIHTVRRSFAVKRPIAGSSSGVGPVPTGFLPVLRGSALSAASRFILPARRQPRSPRC